MATVELRYSPQNTAWFTTNAAMILKAGEPAYHETTGQFKLGDGVTALSALSFLPAATSTPTLQQVLTAGAVATTTVETTGFIKTGGLSTQFLKADGSVDSSTYITASALSPYLTSAAAASTYQPIGSYALTTNTLSQFASTTSAQLAGVISDETGSGKLVFATSPTFTTNITTPNVQLINGAAQGFILNDATSIALGSITATDVEFYYNNLLKLKIIANEFRFSEATNLYFGTTTGTIIGVSTSQKLALWGKTPIVQPDNTVSINDILVNTGLRASGGTSLFTNTVTINNPSASSRIDFVKSTVSAFFLNDGSSYAFGTSTAHKTEVYYNNALNFKFGTNFELTNAVNIQMGTTTGSKICSSTSQKLAFWNKTPIVQPTTGITGAAFVASAGTAVNDASTFGGYTIKQIAAALVNVGILA